MEDIEGYVSKLKVVDLKEELKKRGLSYAGNKAALASRLQEAMEKESASEDGAPTTVDADSAQDEAAENSQEQAAQPDEEPQQQPDEPSQLEPTNNDTSEHEAEQPEPTTTENTESEKPEITEPEPEITGPEPEITEPEPEITGPEPEITEPEPEITEPESEITESEAENPEGKPQITESEAEITGPEQTESSEDKPATESAQSDQPESSAEEPEAMAAEDSEQQANTEDPVTAEASTDEQMDTTSTEQDQVKNENGDSDIGTKRPLDGEGDKEEAKKDDPDSAPDPEEPESFDDTIVLIESKFEPPEDESTVTLDKYASDMYFCFNDDGLGGSNLTEHGFARLWANVRGNTGAKDGKYCYSVTVEEFLPVELPESDEEHHAIRVGWCLYDNRRDVGMDRNSYGYCSNAQKINTSNFEPYGEEYGPGDTITCFLDFASTPATISFAKNNVNQGIAYNLEESHFGRKLYPTISSKNVRYTVSFQGTVDIEGLEEYKFLQDITEEHALRAPKGPPMAECEVFLMVGLPTSGKTTWAEKHCDKNPSKRFVILGSNFILSKMRITGLTMREDKEKYQNLMKEINLIVNKMFLMAKDNHKNYIIDQCSVYKTTQERKMKYFEGYSRRAAVVIPPHHELRRRTSIRTEVVGGTLPDTEINALKANFHIPKTADGLFTEVAYSDIYGLASEKIVRQYREDALGLPSYPQSKRGRYNDYNRGGGGNRHYYNNRGGGQYGGSPGPYHGYSPRGQYGGPPRYNNYPRYSPYGPPQQPMYGGPPRGYGSPQPYRPYGGNPGYRPGPPQPRRGGGYYSRY